MVIKGIITEINYNTNTGSVRIPQFETASTKGEIIIPCTFAIPPGVYNGYQVNDIVWAAFETNNYSHPVIIGKLYLGATKEGSQEGGGGNFIDLKVSNSAVLPLDTKFLRYSGSTVTNAEINSSYTTLTAFIADLSDLKQKIQEKDERRTVYSIREQRIGQWVSQQALFNRTITYTSGITEINLPELVDKKMIYDEIFIDISHSYYYSTPTQISNITTGTINLTAQQINVPATATETTAYVTILYTKKQKVE